jgi:hypothetical protein
MIGSLQDDWTIFNIDHPATACQRAATRAARWLTRHCERSEAIQEASGINERWIATSLRASR